MLRKNFLVILFIITCCSAFSQTKQTSSKPKPSTNSAQGKYNTASTQAMVNYLKHDTCLNKKFSIIFYLIQDSAFTLTSNPATWTSYSLALLMNNLNTAFKPICVSFEHCKTVIIPNYMFNKWNKHQVDPLVTASYYSDKTINVYIVDNLAMSVDAPELAYTYSPSSTPTVATKDVIVLEKSIFGGYNLANYTGSGLCHVFGHYFGLPHTFAEIDPQNVPTPPPVTSTMTYEYFDRTNLSNCYGHGDGFCDTDADPFLNGNIDGKGNFYTPPIDNFMSMYNHRCRFTQEQYNYMARYIMKYRMYLH